MFQLLCKLTSIFSCKESIDKLLITNNEYEGKESTEMITRYSSAQTVLVTEIAYSV
jgi:hypothetical protein